MKYIQVIDGSDNCSFSVYSLSDECFSAIFPDEGQDVAFIEDLIKQLGTRQSGELIITATSNRVEKTILKGINGTLFIQLPEKRKWYPNRRESDLDKPNLDLLLRNSSKTNARLTKK